jgi:hypothetical protein
VKVERELLDDPSAYFDAHLLPAAALDVHVHRAVSHLRFFFVMGNPA